MDAVLVDFDGLLATPTFTTTEARLVANRSLRSLECGSTAGRESAWEEYFTEFA
jgi:hypothetical protein